MPCNTVLAALGGAGYSSCNKMVFKPFYQETVLSRDFRQIRNILRATTGRPYEQIRKSTAR